MGTLMTARQLLDREFLELRARLLDMAAALDRIDRGVGSQELRGDARYRQLQDAVRLLTDDRPDRAERAQMIFSLPYDPNWRSPATL